MKSTQKSLLNMFDAVLAHFQPNLNLVASSPALQTAYNNFKARVANINSTFELESQVISGVVTDKKRLKKLLSELFADNASLMYAYATNLDNNELKEGVKFSTSRLFNEDENDLVNICENLIKLAQENLASLKEYGIDQATVTLMQASLENYKSGQARKHTTITQRKNSTRDGNIQIRDARKFLQTVLDKLMVKFRFSEPAFFNGYFIAREVDDPKTSATQIKGIAADKASHLGIAGMRVEATLNDKTVTTITDANGKYILKTPQPGIWKLKFYHIDYTETGAMEVEIILGKKKVVNVEFDKKK